MVRMLGEVFLSYLTTCWKYIGSFIKTMIFFIFLFSFYLFYTLISFRYTMSGNLFLEAFKNYVFFLLCSVPFAVILNSSLFLSKFKDNKRYLFKIIPLIALVNSMFFYLFLLARVNFVPLPPFYQYYYYPDVKNGYINSIGDYKIALPYGRKSGILFFGKAYFFNSISVGEDRIYINTYKKIEDNSLAPFNSSYTAPRKAQVLQIQDSGVTHKIFNLYIEYILKIERMLNAHIPLSRGAICIIYLILISMGITGLVGGASVFFYDNQTLSLSWSTLFVISALLFTFLPIYLSTISSLKIGVRNDFLREILPSFVVSLCALLIGYALIELKYILAMKRTSVPIKENERFSS